MTMVADRVVQSLSKQTRLHAVQEGQHDPAFWGYFAKLASAAKPAVAINDDMTKAAINHFDPSSYRDTAGRWPVLRQKLSAIQQQIRMSGRLAPAALAELGQEDMTSMVTTFDETPPPAPDAPAPDSSIPGMVTTIDQTPTSPAAAPAPSSIPGMVTTYEQAMTPPTSSIPGMTTSYDQTPTTPATDASSSPASTAAAAAGAAASVAPSPSIQPISAPAPSASSDVWGAIASAVKIAAPVASSIWTSGVSPKPAQITPVQASSTTRLLLGILGVGGLLYAFSLMSKGRR